MEKTAIIAMSGGVDSAVAAHLIKKQGYNAFGVTLRLFDSSFNGSDTPASCCSSSEIEYASEVCKALGINHEVIDYHKNFSEYVINKFIKIYEEGGTPNPCIDCNRHIKFNAVFDLAQKMNYDYIVTGHYVRREYDEKTGKYLIKKALDDTKDQSYVLYSLTQEQLSHTLFPLGELKKTDVRHIASELGFKNAQKPDSQDICFVPDGNYAEFIEKYTGNQSKCGDFVTKSGKVLGRHKGLIHYTIGQRKGLGLSVPEPVYVCEKNIHDNTVIVDTIEHLYSDSLTAGDINIISGETIEDGFSVTVKTRYRQKEVPAKLYNDENGKIKVNFLSPVKAVTKGQAVVFYNGDILIGGGTIL